MKRLQLLTSKPVLYVCNVEEALGGDRQCVLGAGGGAGARRKARAWSWCPRRSRRRWRSCRKPIAAEFLEGLGLHDSGLDRVIRAGYDLLGLVTYLHRRAEGDARLDDRARHQGAAGRRR